MAPADMKHCEKGDVWRMMMMVMVMKRGRKKSCCTVTREKEEKKPYIAVYRDILK